MEREIQRGRAKGWEMTAIARRFEEKGWADPFEVRTEAHYAAIRRYVKKSEPPGSTTHKGKVNPYLPFHLRPEMVAAARKAIDAGRPLDELLRVFYGRGWVEDGQIRYCWFKLKRLASEDAEDVELLDAVEAVEALAGNSLRGQGWRVSAEERRALERYAVEYAVEDLVGEGWSVEDVGSTESYDLLCVRGGITLHVEVKGTTTAGEQVFLTANEVAHARETRVALFLVTKIKLRTSNRRIHCSGGEGWIYDPWKIDRDGELRPVGYSYALKE